MAALIFTGVALPVQAKPLRPDAGQILRENTAPSPPLPQPGENRLQTPAQRQEAEPAKGGATLLVKGFTFRGNDHIASEQLLNDIPVLGRAIGTRLDMAGLNALAMAVKEYYREHGYTVATAYIPAQEAKGGIITIAVLEGRYDRTFIRGTYGNIGYSPKRLKSFLDKNLCGKATPGCKGEVIKRGKIDRALGIISNLPGLSDTTAALGPGRAVGTSVFELNADAGPSWNAHFGVDNYGNRYTGQTRGTAALVLNNPLKIGDKLDLDFTTSGKGQNSGAFGYSLPVGYGGGRLGLGYTRSAYTLGAPFNDLDAHGWAQVLSSSLTYPLIRSNRHNLFIHADYSYKWLEDSYLDNTSKKREWTVSLGVSGNLVDRLGGGALSSYGLTFTGGSLDRDNRQAGYGGAAGTLGKVNLRLGRDQTLAYLSGDNRISLYGSLVGQWALTNLDSVEKFSLGGPDGVRAYPVGEATGDTGAVVTLELRYSLPVAPPLLGKSDCSLFLFRDQGWLRVNHSSWPGYTGPEHRQLGGTGIGVGLVRRDRFALKLMWAFRDPGGEKATSAPDANSQLWAQASASF